MSWRVNDFPADFSPRSRHLAKPCRSAQHADHSAADPQSQNDGQGRERVDQDADSIVVPVNAVVGRATLPAADGVDDQGSDEPAPPRPAHPGGIGSPAVGTVGIVTAAPDPSAAPREIVVIVPGAASRPLLIVSISAPGSIVFLVIRTPPDSIVFFRGTLADSIVLDIPSAGAVLPAGSVFLFRRRFRFAWAGGGGALSDRNGEDALAFRATNLPPNMFICRGEFMGTRWTGKVNHARASLGLSSRDQVGAAGTARGNVKQGPHPGKPVWEPLSRWRMPTRVGPAPPGPETPVGMIPGRDSNQPRDPWEAGSRIDSAATQSI
jgi:hypothetical protein